MSGPKLIRPIDPWTNVRPTQLSTLSGTENDYRPKCGDTVRLGSKGRYSSFHLWINVWVACKTVRSSLTRAVPERFRDEFLMIKRYTNLVLYTPLLQWLWYQFVLVSDIAVFVLKRDVKLQLSHQFVPTQGSKKNTKASPRAARRWPFVRSSSLLQPGPPK